MKSLESNANQPCASRRSSWNLESQITDHSDSSDGDGSLSPVSINSIAGPSRSILADFDNVANSEDEDDIP